MVEILDEVQQQEPVQQDPPSKRKALYDAASKSYDLGTYDEFEQKLKDPAKRKALYDNIGEEFDLGTFDEFEKKISDSKKKVASVLVGESFSSPELGSEAQSTSSNEIPTVSDFGNGELVPDDAISVAKKYKEYKDAVKPVSDIEMGMSRGMAKPLPDEDKRTAAEEMRKDLESRGYDAEKIANDFDFPEYVFNSIPKDKLLADYKDNPQLYEREIATAKWQTKLRELLP